MWFTSWASLGRIVLFAVASFATLLALIRLLGQRTISKMNPSDFIITVAVGSTLAAFLLTKDVSLADGLTALATLLLLQAATEWATTRSERIRRLTEGSPVLLVYRGQLARDTMRRQKVNDHEVIEALRQHGVNDPKDVLAVVLEIDGTFSVLTGSGPSEAVLRDVKRQ